MPHRIYRGKQPPTFLDHVLAHPWELVFSAWSAFIGAATIATTITHAGATTSSSVAQLPNPLIYALGSMLVVGGVQTWRGIFNNSTDLMDGFTRERVGLVLISTAWLVYAIAVLSAFPGAISSWTSGLALSLAAGLRVAATLRDEQLLRGQP